MRAEREGSSWERERWARTTVLAIAPERRAVHIFPESVMAGVAKGKAAHVFKKSVMPGLPCWKNQE